MRLLLPAATRAGVLIVALIVVVGTFKFVYQQRPTATMAVSPSSANHATSAMATTKSSTKTPPASTPNASVPVPMKHSRQSSGTPTGSGSSPPPSGGSNEAFLIVCGTQLCLQGKPFIIHGATAYGTYDNPSAEVRLAQAGRVNVLELVEFDTQYHTLSDTMSDATWTRVDKFIAAAKQAGLHVILNLSEYGQSLQAAGRTPTTVDWKPYLRFIANRTNTITRVRYKNDPTIAMVEIFGEIDAPNYKIHPGTEGTTAEIIAFFHRTEAEWHALAPNILISTGGFSYLNDPTSGIDWRSIMSDAADPVCDIEINSPQDLATTVGEVTKYCKSLHKPWFLAAWSSCYQDTGYPYYLADDHAMAQHAQAMYDVAKGNSPATYAAIGADFWNLQKAGTPAGTCSISPSFPLTWATVRSNAPRGYLLISR